MVVGAGRCRAGRSAGAIDDPVYIGCGAQGPSGHATSLTRTEMIPLFVPLLIHPLLVLATPSSPISPRAKNAWKINVSPAPPPPPNPCDLSDTCPRRRSSGNSNQTRLIRDLRTSNPFNFSFLYRYLRSLSLPPKPNFVCVISGRYISDEKQLGWSSDKRDYGRSETRGPFS